MKLLAEHNIEIENTKIFLIIFKLYKSYLLLISDQEELGIGNVTLGSPPIINGVKPPSISYNLFGVNSNLLSTIIVERVSSALNAPILLLLFLRNELNIEKMIKPVINFINKIIEGIMEKKSNE
ncbi:MAG: hypothetical protein ACFFE4_16690 [Candidatus Thorarchaeota archaeon]